MQDAPPISLDYNDALKFKSKNKSRYLLCEKYDVMLLITRNRSFTCRNQFIKRFLNELHSNILRADAPRVSN